MEKQYKTLEELEAARAVRQAAQAAKKKKRKKARRVAVTCVILALVIGVLSVAATLVVRDIKGIGGDEKNYMIDVPAGAGASKVASLLKNRGIIEYPTVFKLYAGDRYMFQQGRHSVNSSMSYKELLETFGSYAEGGVGEQVQVIIPEGYELRQIADLLEEKNLIDRDVFMDEVENGEFDYSFVDAIPERENRLEGYLYPATYNIFPGTSEHDIISMMLNAFKDNVMPVYNASGTSDSVDYIVTMASVIVREAANDDEKKLVASVFNNRLYEGKKLESCATVQYILHERKTVLSEADTAIKSPYNTYRNKGLPIGPIASPGLASIKAALKPAVTEYMYFVADPSGNKNYFSRTYEEHKEKIEKLNRGESVTDSEPFKATATPKPE